MKIAAEKVEQAYRQFKTALTPKEDDVITRYYGISPHVRHTLAEIGGMYKVTRERIRQIKGDALQKLKVKK
jgi:RNA polymerase primary sigma factor